jgi:hypothetical protein
MVWIPLSNGSGQVVKGITVKAFRGSIVYKNGSDIEIKLEHPKTFTVIGSKRLGINRYKLNLTEGYYTKNHHMRKTNQRPGWTLIGNWLSPEAIAKSFGSKLDKDANKPRPERESFWKMKSRKGSHNYKQKKRLMKDVKFKKFSKYFKNTIAD